jgi:uroporphyrinogen III methyltransferase / synthase
MAERDDETRPLRGRIVVVTRPREQAQALVEPLERLGAEVLVAPTIKIVPLALDDELITAAADLGSYDLVVFTSANAVRHFTDRVGEWLRRIGGPVDVDDHAEELTVALGGTMIAAVGPRTADVLAERGLPCDIVPREAVAEGLLEALDGAELDLDGAHVLVPRAREARDLLPDTLRERGAQVSVVTVYETLPADELGVTLAQLAAADVITFTSGSTVHQFVALAGSSDLAGLLTGVRLVSIGPQTSQALADHGLPVAAEADPHTGEGIVQAILALSARP